MANLKKALANTFRILFIVLLLFILFLAIQLIRHPDAPPSIFGYQPFTVLSNSMNPSFETGDLIIVKKVASSSVKEGDVITFRESNDKFVTHRVVEVIQQNGNPGFVTKGDNNNVNDDHVVSSENVVGKKVLHIKNGGLITKFVGSPIGLILFVFLPLIGYFGLTLWEHTRKRYHSRKSST
ncbi:signal peptidase I [Paucisalibacillus sp. EB02]|uniref:signal peptidase I n=1 Tax=Paucisalibacillus sp. EB02 TaxID=1347087 RepID=UPI0004B5C7D5|nr:signal peptidase I [Paucisalibacillus sp. EB02]